MAAHDRVAEIPIIMIAADAHDPDAVREAQQLGARAVLARTDDEQLVWTIQREVTDLRQRRRARELAARLKQCERRSRELVEQSGTAIAFVKQGLHLDANSAYLTLHGYPNLVRRHSELLRDLGLTHGPDIVDGFGPVLASVADRAHALTRISDDGSP